MRPEQEEEIEVLESIYDGDSNYTAVNSTTYQYKYENDCENKSFIIEITWGENYPDEAPQINLDLFYNKHIVSDVKELLLSSLQEQADSNLGMSMTFTLFEWLKEAKDDILKNQPAVLAAVTPTSESNMSSTLNNLTIEDDNTKKKKENLTKSQKRRMWDRQNAAGERERGSDWVDVIKHLSQSGRSTD